MLQHGGAAVFKLPERSHLPPALSAYYLTRGQTQVLNVRQNKRIDCHTAECDEHSAPECISGKENWLNWNSDLDNPNMSEDEWKADDKTNGELDNCIEDPESL